MGRWAEDFGFWMLDVGFMEEVERSFLQRSRRRKWCEGEKVGKEFRIRKIKIQRRLSGQHIGVAKTLDTTCCTHKEKTATYSKVVHTFAT